MQVENRNAASFLIQHDVLKFNTNMIILIINLITIWLIVWQLENSVS